MRRGEALAGAGVVGGAFAIYWGVAATRADQSAEDALARSARASAEGDDDGALGEALLAASSYSPIGGAWERGFAALEAAGGAAEAKKDGARAAKTYEAMREAAIASDAWGHDTGSFVREAEAGRIRAEGLLADHAPYPSAEGASVALRTGWAEHPLPSPTSYVALGAASVILLGAVAFALALRAGRNRAT